MPVVFMFQPKKASLALFVAVLAWPQAINAIAQPAYESDMHSAKEEVARRFDLLERQCRHYCAETIELVRPYSSDAERESIVTRVLRDGSGRFRVHVATRSGANVKKQGDTLTAWNGRTYTVCRPTVFVTHYIAVVPPQPSAQPFGAILETLGFFGEPSEFARSASTNLQVNKANSSRVTLTRSFVADRPAKAYQIEMDLDLANGLKVLAAQRSSGTSGEAQTLVKISVLSWEREADALTYSFTTSEYYNGKILTDRLTAVHADGKIEHSSVEEFCLTEHAGNPWVRVYLSGALTSQGPYHPLIKSPAQHSAFQRWLRINGVLFLLGSTGLLVWNVRAAFLKLRTS